MTERRYGRGAEFPQGHPEDLKCCIEKVQGRDRWPSYHQCRRPRGHGPGGKYCWQHARMVEKKKNADQR